jgi:hypothetical protein
MTMPTDLSIIDLATINAAHQVIISSIRNKVCEWEQQSCDAAADGCLANALMLEQWAFAADLLATTVSSEFNNFFCQSITARFGDLNASNHRSATDQVLDAISLEVASAQEAPELVPV